MDKSLSIVIPAYNEEGKIKKTLISVKNEIGRSLPYDIIVVDDGSTDKTADIVNRIDGVNLIKLQTNRGKGAALKAGISEANGSLILFMDADGSTSLSHIDEFVDLSDRYDLIIASRSLPESKIVKRQPLHKEFFGRGGNLLIKKILGLNYSDTQCGFKLFHKKVADSVLEKVEATGWAFDFEMLLLANKSNFKVKEVPVIWENDRKSKVKTRDYIKTFIDLLKVKVRHDLKSIKKTVHQFIKFFITGLMNAAIDFSILNLLIVAFGLGGSTYNYAVFKIISVLAAMTNSFFWNKRWVFKKRNCGKREVALFYLVAFIGLGIDVLVSIISFHYLTILNSLSDQLNANIAALIGLAVVVFWDFFGYKFIVFKK